VVSQFLNGDAAPGGFPQVYLLISWGGNEGQHTIANMTASLLGDAARSPLAVLVQPMHK
jgi:hypothetical protein